MVGAMKCFQEQIAMMVALRQMHHVPAASANQPSWDYQQVRTQCFQRRVQVVGRQAQPLWRATITLPH